LWQDDGGAGSEYSDCAFGTDCQDCGGPRCPGDEGDAVDEGADANFYTHNSSYDTMFEEVDASPFLPPPSLPQAEAIPPAPIIGPILLGAGAALVTLCAGIFFCWWCTKRAGGGPMRMIEMSSIISPSQHRSDW